MKLLILFSIAVLASLCAYAQRVNISFKNAAFRELLKAIEQQTGYSFIYTTEQLQYLPTVNIKEDNINVFRLLDRQLRKTPIRYIVNNNFIILISPQLLRGKVTDHSGKAIAGATIQTENDGITAITNEQGQFEIKEIPPDEKLRVSGAEIEPFTFVAGTNTYIEIKVKELIRELDETIILGYGSTTKRYNTGNAVKVKAAELNGGAGRDLLYTLQGRVPGLLITTSGGTPASSYVMQVRGQHSINPNPLINYRIPPADQPLIILNGVPFAPQNNNVNQLMSIASPGTNDIYNNPYGGISPFSIIDPSDIESMEILKDAVSTAIYGSRAANGILLITTRQPGNEKFIVQTDISTGVNLIASGPEMLSTKDYLQLRKAAFRIDNLQPDLVQGSPAYAPDILLFDSAAYTNWRKYFFHNAAPLTNIHTRVSGRSGRFSFLSTLGYRNETYLLKGNFYKRQFSTANSIRYGSHNNRFTASASGYYSYGYNQSATSPVLLQAFNLPPNYPDLYDPNGNVNWNYNGVELPDNPAALLQQPYTINISGLTVGVKTDYVLSKELALRLNAGYSGFTTNETSVIPAATLDSRSKSNARSIFARNIFRTKIIEPQLEFKTNKGRFAISGLAGITFQQNEVNLASEKGSRYADDGSMNSLTNAGRIDRRSIKDIYTYSSYFNRMNLNYAGKYLLHFSGRNDHSSRFTNGSRSALFSSVGMGWIFSEEPFFKQKTSLLDFGKFRFSYGNTGNDNIGYYHYLDAWSRTASYTGNQALPTGLNEASFSWSVTRKAEAALELRLLNDRLSVEITRYDHRCSDQLISQLSSTQPHVTRYISNFPAIVSNSGWEITAGVYADKNKKMRWSSRFNVTLPRNRLKIFPGIESSLYAGSYWPEQPLNAVRVIHFTGVDPETGTYIFSQEQASYTSTMPVAYGGLSGDLQYKEWSGELFFEFRKQRGANYLQQIHQYPPGFRVNQPVLVTDHWNNPGDAASFQRPLLSDLSAARQAAFLLMLSDAAYSDASYVRLRSLRVSRAFKATQDTKTGWKGNIYIQLQNVFTLTSFRVSDPEVQSYYSYPLARAVMIGLEIKL